MVEGWGSRSPFGETWTKIRRQLFATIDRLFFASCLHCENSGALGGAAPHSCKRWSKIRTHCFLHRFDGSVGCGGAPPFAKHGRRSEHAASCTPLMDVFPNAFALRNTVAAICYMRILPRGTNTGIQDERAFPRAPNSATYNIPSLRRAANMRDLSRNANIAICTFTGDLKDFKSSTCCS